MPHRNFWCFFSGYLASEIGNRIFYLSVFWWVEHQTQNPQLVAWLGLAITVPQLFSFITGAVSDVYNRKHVMMTTDFLSMLIVLIMTLYFKTFVFPISLYSFSFSF